MSPKSLIQCVKIFHKCSLRNSADRSLILVGIRRYFTLSVASVYLYWSGRNSEDSKSSLFEVAATFLCSECIFLYAYDPDTPRQNNNRI